MILYFSGTGNSKWIASVLAEETHQQLVSINELLKNKQRLWQILLSWLRLYSKLTYYSP